MQFTKHTVALALATVGSVSSQGTILDVVVGSDAHNTLEAAVTTAPSQIADFLASDTEDGITLFAPDDTAFAALPDGTVALLTTLPWTAHLVCVLTGTYHALQRHCLCRHVRGFLDILRFSFHLSSCFFDESPQVMCTKPRFLLVPLRVQFLCLR